MLKYGFIKIDLCNKLLHVLADDSRVELMIEDGSDVDDKEAALDNGSLKSYKWWAHFPELSADCCLSMDEETYGIMMRWGDVRHKPNRIISVTKEHVNMK